MNKVLFFAHLRDTVGEEFLKLDAAGKTIGELKAELALNTIFQNWTRS